MGYVGYGHQEIIRMLRIPLVNGDHPLRMNGLKDLLGESLQIIVTQIRLEEDLVILNMLRQRGM